MVDLEGGTGRLALDVDRGRLLSLLSVAAERPVEAEAVMPAIEAAARYWQRGDKALANLRLVFSPLPRPADEAVVRRLSLASRALSNGMAPATLLRAAWSKNFRGLTLRYHPDQPRIPGGHGIESGRWTFAETGDPKDVARDRRIQVAEDDDPKVTSDLPLPNHAEVEHNATASVVLDHHRIHVLDPVSHLPRRDRSAKFAAGRQGGGGGGADRCWSGGGTGLRDGRAPKDEAEFRSSETSVP